MIARRSGIERKMELAKTIAGINQDTYFEKIISKDEKVHWEEVKKKIHDKVVQLY
jgi:methionyl-tRNA formyltransferase